MGIRDIITAVREYPGTRDALESVAADLCVKEAEVEYLEQHCEEMQNAGHQQLYEIRILEQDKKALTAALREFCPSLEDTQDMKRFYAAVSRDLDAGGFKLYHAAVKITGISVFEQFPYEDNMGYFEEMDGHHLLNYLTASYCGTVEWEIVPGTIHEKAILHKPDTATQTYQDFLTKLYAQVLVDMGFQDFISTGLTRTLEHGDNQKYAKGPHSKVPRRSQGRDNAR